MLTSSKFTKKSLFFMILLFLVLLISCGRVSEPKIPPAEETKQPLFDSQDLRRAKPAKFIRKALVHGSEITLSATEKELLSDPVEAENNLSPQTVIASVDGWVVYIRSNGTTYQIYRHDQTNDARLLVFSGSDEIQSVAISSDGDHIVATIYDAANANFEVYELVISSGLVTNLSNTPDIDETHVSISAAGNIIVWEGEEGGRRAPYLCFYTVLGCKFIILTSSNNQVQPSISGNGIYVALIEELSSGSDRIKVYKFPDEGNTDGTYTIVATSSLPLEHPSVSDNGTKVMYLQHDTAAGIDRIKIKDLSTGVTTTERSATTPLFLEHPHITADGLYLTYGVESSTTGKLLAKTRDIASNLEGSTSNVSYDHFGTFWQKPIASYSHIYVDKDAIGNNSGRDWNNAFVKLQDALNCARVGACPGTNQIWVASGAYYPDEGVFETDNDETASFELINGFYLTGGFDGVGAGGIGGAQETGAAQRNLATNITILSGDILQDDLNTDGNTIAETTTDIVGDNTDCVIYAVTNSLTTVLDGFTITAGQSRENDPNTGNGAGMRSYGEIAMTTLTFSGNYNDVGGGALFLSGSSAPTISNSIFTGNSADFGGAIHMFNSNAELFYVTFTSNSAGNSGGAIYSTTSDPTLTHITFFSNSANYGGALFNANSDPVLSNVIFSGNLAVGAGGALFTSTNINASLTNVIFSGNATTAGPGGAIYAQTSFGNSDSVNLTLLNVSFSQNTASTSGGAIYSLRGNGTLTISIKNTILWNNQAAGIDNEIYNDGATINIRYSDVKGGWNGAGVVNVNSGTTTSGGGNLKTNPRFMDADGPDNLVGTLDDNLHLSYSGTVSPLIDRGTNNGVTAATDLQGNSRIVDGDGNGTATVDMGAYEKQ